VIIAEELARYGVRANAILPRRRTRMTESTPGLSELRRKPADAASLDVWIPPTFAVGGDLAMRDCEASGQVFFVKVARAQVPELDDDRDP